MFSSVIEQRGYKFSHISLK